MQPKKEQSMRWKFDRLLLILSGILVTILIAAGLVIVLFFPEMLPSRTETQSEATAELFAMDTYITITAYGEDAETALSDAKDKLAELERLWSVTNPDSDIYTVNHSNGQSVSVVRKLPSCFLLHCKWRRKPTALWNRLFIRC